MLPTIALVVAIIIGIGLVAHAGEIARASVRVWPFVRDATGAFLVAALYVILFGPFVLAGGLLAYIAGWNVLRILS